MGGIAIKVKGVGVGTLPELQGVGLQCKAEGQETLTVRLPTSAGQPRHMRMHVAVCLHTQTSTIIVSYKVADYYNIISFIFLLRGGDDDSARFLCVYPHSFYGHFH